MRASVLEPTAPGGEEALVWWGQGVDVGHDEAPAIANLEPRLTDGRRAPQRKIDGRGNAGSSQDTPRPD